LGIGLEWAHKNKTGKNGTRGGGERIKQPGVFRRPGSIKSPGRRNQFFMPADKTPGKVASTRMKAAVATIKRVVKRLARSFMITESRCFPLAVSRTSGGSFPFYISSGAFPRGRKDVRAKGRGRGLGEGFASPASALSPFLPRPGPLTAA
jgi:hypothetical protein